jgi:hypothetical protein
MRGASPAHQFSFGLKPCSAHPRAQPVISTITRGPKIVAAATACLSAVQRGLRPMVYYMCTVNWDRDLHSNGLPGPNRLHREAILAPNYAEGWSRIGTVAVYSGTVFCFPQFINRFDGNSPVTSQGHHVRRHSVACIDLRLNAPRVTQPTNPRSSRSLNAREAVSLAMLQRSAACRTDSPIRPLLVPS